MTDWKGEDLIRAQPNTEGYRGRPLPQGRSMIIRRTNGKAICTVPGCDNVLGSSNSTGVCKGHSHHVDHCRCAICVTKRGTHDA